MGPSSDLTLSRCPGCADVLTVLAIFSARSDAARCSCQMTPKLYHFVTVDIFPPRSSAYATTYHPAPDAFRHLRTACTPSVCWPPDRSGARAASFPRRPRTVGETRRCCAFPGPLTTQGREKSAPLVTVQRSDPSYSARIVERQRCNGSRCSPSTWMRAVAIAPSTFFRRGKGGVALRPGRTRSAQRHVRAMLRNRSRFRFEQQAP